MRQMEIENYRQFETVCRDIIASGKKPTSDVVIPLAKFFYTLPGNSVGGSLHITLDDGNVDASHVIFCLEESERRDDEAGRLLSKVLLLCSVTQRLKIHRAT